LSAVEREKPEKPRSDSWKPTLYLYSGQCWEDVTNRAQTRTDIARGYTLLLETLHGFSTSPVLPFNAEAIEVFDGLRTQKIRISTMDLRIESIALSRNLVLLTRNVNDFSKVLGLTTEDWTV